VLPVSLAALTKQGERRSNVAFPFCRACPWPLFDASVSISPATTPTERPANKRRQRLIHDRPDRAQRMIAPHSRLEIHVAEQFTSRIVPAAHPSPLYLSGVLLPDAGLGRGNRGLGHAGSLHAIAIQGAPSVVSMTLT
jgi:hypothetical protein